MKIDLLCAEIGSTTTVVNAFDDLDGNNPVFLGQGVAATTVQDGDVMIGLQRAKDDLQSRLMTDTLEAADVLATSSAAGGLTMTVHGLVPDMTVRAAREAALGSGAVIRAVTAGKLRPSDIERCLAVRPRIVMVSGGVDHGERATALFNFEALAKALPDVPILYAGNVDNHDDIRRLAERFGTPLYITQNVYPTLDELNVAPAREVIQTVFESHIVEAPGMARIRDTVTGAIMPTPGAVMAMAEHLYDALGDLLVLDVGGATTDVHSVTWGSERFRPMITSPEPFSKRSVEGDLGVFLNRSQVIGAMTYQERCLLPSTYEEELLCIPDMPRTEEEIQLILPLVFTCASEALNRHAGQLVEHYTPRGRVQTVRGRDLSAVGTVLATGGALTRLPSVESMVRRLIDEAPLEKLYPPSSADVKIDHNYIMASCGVMTRKYPEAAMQLMRASWSFRS
ncbi:MAG: DNA mismatch repair protein MutL [Clostridiaceae bacterium]|nr:DNA mismatch repair protein MutL [Clostridiaceae bacterium]